MKKISYFISILLISMSFNVYADNVSKQVLIKELFSLTQVDTLLEKIKKKLDEGLNESFRQLGGEKEDEETYKKYSKKFSTEFDKKLSWEKLEPSYIEIYDKSFSEKEIATIVQFYRTPAGRKMAEKSPDIMLQFTEMNKEHIITIIPTLRDIGRDMGKELIKIKKEKEKAKKKTEEKSKEKAEEKK